MIVIILGPPGSGKSTQSKLLAKKLGVPSISMGRILRNAIDAKTNFGVEAEKYVDNGKLVPSKLIEILTKFRLEEEDCTDGFVLDGAPRRGEEAIILDEYLSKKGKKIDYVLLLKVSDKEVIKRLLKRSKLPKEKGGAREDDNMEDIYVRLCEYRDHLEAVKVYYEKKGLLLQVNGEDTIENIEKDIARTLQI